MNFLLKKKKWNYGYQHINSYIAQVSGTSWLWPSFEATTKSTNKKRKRPKKPSKQKKQTKKIECFFFFLSEMTSPTALNTKIRGENN